MHSLNAYFGRKAYTPGTFGTMCREYDTEVGLPPGTTAAGGTGTLLGHMGHGPRRTILHYAIAKMDHPYDEALGVTAPWESPGCVRKTSGGVAIKVWNRPRLCPDDLMASGIRAVMIFDRRHIWAWRSDGTHWYKVDSLAGGAVKGNPRSEWNGPNGLIIAVPRRWRPLADPETPVPTEAGPSGI
jgi:hypothetical protein